MRALNVTEVHVKLYKLTFSMSESHGPLVIMVKYCNMPHFQLNLS